MAADLKYIREISDIRYKLNINDRIRSKDEEKTRPKIKQKWYQTTKL